MVHRPADSRLLGNLLSQEKEYAKHLATLLDHSNASLASVTAYGSASSPASAHLILAVAGSLAVADDALRHYAAAVDRWRDYLKGLKALEDEASKPALHNSHSSSSLPLSSSPNQSHASLPFSAHTPTNAKLVAAQTELQACEAHLAAKEAELEIRRSALVRDGLAGRCRALAECGAHWQEAGRAGVLSAQGGSQSPTAPSDPNKPLPGVVSGSDVSLAPSQSASQINLYVDPVHPPSSSDHHMMLPPVDLVPIASPSSKFAPHVLARRITEENLMQMPADDDGEGSSVAEEAEDSAKLEVVENPRFASANKPTNFTTNKGSGILKRSGTNGALPSKLDSSSGFFGSIRGLFGRRGAGGSDVGTGSRLKRSKREAAADSGDDEPDVRSEPAIPVAARKRVVSDIGSQRRRKGLTDDDVGIRRAEEWVGGQGGLVLPRQADSDAAAADDKGWASDEGGTIKRRKSKGKTKTSSPEGTVRSVNSVASDSQIVISPKQKRRSSMRWYLLPTAPTPTTSTRTERRTSLPVHPAPRLMSIVEGVSRANRTGWATYNGVGLGNPTSPTTPTAPTNGLVEVKAPRFDAPVSPSASESRGRTLSTGTIVPVPIDGLPRAPGSIFSTPAVPSTFAGTRDGFWVFVDTKRPQKSPLRSALRVSSTPSPPSSQVQTATQPHTHAHFTQPVAIVAPVAVKPPQPPPFLVPVPIPVPAPVLNGVTTDKDKGKGKELGDLAEEDSDADDYGTFGGDDENENEHEHAHTDDEDTETEHELPPPPPPPHDHSYNKLTNGNIHDSPVVDNPLIEDFGRGPSVGFVHQLGIDAAWRSSGSSAPEERAGVVAADVLEYTACFARGRRRRQWGRSCAVGENQQQRGAVPDLWEDSSEEDVEYQQARRLLTRLAKKESNGKGKGKHKNRDG
ncbi:hypothetical protein C8F01DRAFT_1161524 [Mycena amicta]|nr:hypothetical protein C8F01DRAFT_1161524 [Mycena amicta]